MFRVDHFLGRSTVLNLLGLRFANRIFEPVWNASTSSRVDIVFDEQLALEGRAGYYDKAGALVDMIQSHLLQVMALVAMNPIGQRRRPRPARGEGRGAAGHPRLGRRRRPAPRGARATRRAPSTAARCPTTSRARRRPGAPHRDARRGDPRDRQLALGRRAVPAALGKALGVARKEIVVTFKPVPHLPTGLTGACEPDRLRLGDGPGRDRARPEHQRRGRPHEHRPRQRSTPTLGPGRLPAYGEVLAGMLDGDPLLAVRGDTAVECWRIVDSVLDAWQSGRRSRCRRTPPAPRAPTAGPSDALFRDRRPPVADSTSRARPGISSRLSAIYR